VPAVSLLYHSMALPADVQMRMNEQSADHYRLFGIRTVVTAAGAPVPIAPFWRREQTIGPFDIYATPDTRYFDVVDASAAMHVTKQPFYDVNDRWLQSDWVGKRQHLLLDLGGVPPGTAVAPEGPLPAVRELPLAGSVTSEREGEATVEMTRPACVLYKMTWHPNWHAWVDGTPVTTAMLSPGFLAVPVDAGKHTVTLRYEGSAWKVWLALAGIVAVAAMAVVPKRAKAG